LKYAITHIAKIVNADLHLQQKMEIEYLLVDSRKLQSPALSLFFALKSPRRNGHQFMAELWAKGVRNFVVTEAVDFDKYPGANFLIVADTLVALQNLAAYHRSRFTQSAEQKPFHVIGITGSNGKTIVKEWLYQLLHQDYNIVRSPKSYNSQIGVPLSVWQMNEEHTLAIFEAGISKQGEMERLEKIIQPTIGVLTNIGEAHSEGFKNHDQKEAEKRILFKNAYVPSPLHVVEIKKEASSTKISAWFGYQDTGNLHIEIPFTDDASIQNAITCWRILMCLLVPDEVIKQRMKLLQPVNMRLELKKGINHCTIINDSYSADLSSLEIALNFLEQQSTAGKRTVILSDFLQTSSSDDDLYKQIADSLHTHKINRLIGVGENITKAFRNNSASLAFETSFFNTTDEFEKQFRSSFFKDETLLIKGARIFAFERIVQLLEQKVHQTVLEINLNAIAHNLNEYQRYLKPSTKVMAMVKAFAYGSGGAEVAGILQYHKADYLGVAYADEGVDLRKAGINIPIMVMNPEENAFEAITEYNLQPELYSFETLHSFINYLQSQGIQQYPVHIEVETGMNRLGFAGTAVEKLGEVLAQTGLLQVQSVFTHLAASEEAVQDEFTLQQFELFQKAISVLRNKLPYNFLTHIANSAAAIRHPHLQLDMVRLGIGLYGVDSAVSGKLALHTVTTLKSTIAQIKYLKKGESVSYNRRSVLENDSVIATIRMGYADGYPRRLGNGAGKVWVKDRLVSVVGTICMDMFMIDVTSIPDLAEGDEVIIFGQQLPVEQLAAWAGTIPYEILTGISQRVKRVYFEE
jgi:Alr-MurF fusion protein